MRSDRRQFLTAAGGLLLADRFARPEDGPAGLVNGHPEAAEVGKSILAAGGNAVDAAVAAALVAGVVALPSTGLGGYGGHLIVAQPTGQVEAIDFNGPAPASAKPDLFAADDKGAVKDRANALG